MLTTALFDGAIFDGPAGNLAFARVHQSGATVVRLIVEWKAVAPSSTVAGFSPASPTDRHYKWGVVDQEVRRAVAAGLSPLLDITDAPAWATSNVAHGPGTPDSAKLASFANAAAKRYGGHVAGLPRVRYWQVWNEPNLDPNLSPQLVNGAPAAPKAYREMVNAFADAVKAVNPSNLVVAGGLAPFRDTTSDTRNQDQDWGPLSFMRDMLCLSPRLTPTCSDPVRFDAWSTHPYTSGGPTHHAVLPNDVSLGDLGDMRKVLVAAVKAGHVESASPVQFWVTEFSWDSRPPDPRGVPMRLLQRWVPQALYEMWRNGVSLVTWFSLRDLPLSNSFYQAGLEYVNGARKPLEQGFRFPFVAFPQRASKVYVWGRTPTSRAGSVAIEESKGSSWQRIGTVPASAHGIFTATLKGRTTGYVRARLLSTGERSLSFSLASVPDHVYNPFGETTLLEPQGGKPK